MKLKLMLSAIQELVGRYQELWRYAWQRRHELTPLERTADEAEFLPAALAVQDTPVGPAPKWISRLIIAVFVVGLAGACLFEIDIVVTGNGSIIPVDRVKTVQTLEAAVVRRIAVNEGQHVRAGDILVELFSPGVQTDSSRLAAEYEAASNEFARMTSLSAWINNRDSAYLNALPNSNLLDARLREFSSKIARGQAEVSRREEEILTARSNLEKIQNSISRLDIKAQDYRELEAGGYVSRHASLDQQQQLEDAQSDTRIWKSRLREAQAQLAESRQALSSLDAEMRRVILEQLRDAKIKLSVTEQDLTKYKDRDSLMVLRAPIDGTVSQLNTYTLGGIVPAAHTLMNIVPDGAHIEVEAIIDNKDVGHLVAGQAVRIKIESYPFTQYGSITGSLIAVSATAAKEERRGLIYTARIKLPSAAELQKEFTHSLISGMNAVVEINIGKRSVIAYFLSPLITAVKEAAHER